MRVNSDFVQTAKTMNIKIDFIGKDGIEETGSYNWDVVPQVGDIAKVRDPGGVFVYSDVVPVSYTHLLL